MENGTASPVHCRGVSGGTSSIDIESEVDVVSFGLESEDVFVSSVVENGIAGNVATHHVPDNGANSNCHFHHLHTKDHRNGHGSDIYSDTTAIALDSKWTVDHDSVTSSVYGVHHIHEHGRSRKK